jgi:hypothetical protein
MPRTTFLHIPRLSHGFQCDLPSVELPISVLHGTFNHRFILDTGAAITLIPKNDARSHKIYYDIEQAAPQHRPRTINGRLDGHLGQIQTRFLGLDLRIPCFFYDPPTQSPGPPQAEGPPGGKRAQRNVRDVEEWVEAVRRQEAARADRDGTYTDGTGVSIEDELPWVLGRLGFMHRFHIWIRADETIISTEAFRLPRS